MVSWTVFPYGVRRCDLLGVVGLLVRGLLDEDEAIEVLHLLPSPLLDFCFLFNEAR